jgi:gas vesicle protein
MSNKNQVGAFIGGAILGGALGAVLGLSVAPRTGKETRKVLKKSAEALPELAEDLATTLQMQAGRLSASTLRNWDDTLIRLKSAIAAGVEASQLEQKYEKVAISSKNLNSTTGDRN